MRRELVAETAARVALETQLEPIRSAHQQVRGRENAVSPRRSRAALKNSLTPNSARGRGRWGGSGRRRR